MHDFLSSLGALALLYLAVRVLYLVLKELYLNVIAPSLNLGINWSKLRGWAVVTGATDGIGKEYAIQLARKGLNIVLVSRSQAKLDATAMEIEKENHVQTKTIAVDFSGGIEIYDKIKKELENLHISVLVNNVGKSYDQYERFSSIENRNKFCLDLVKVNIISTLMMTDMIVPQMEKRKSGLIINIGSFSSAAPTPLLAVYSASKAFIDFISQCLEMEYRRDGITIQTVLPVFVGTKMAKKIAPPNDPSVVSPDAYVSWTLKTVGIEGRTFGHPIHKIQAFLFNLLYYNVPSPIFKFGQYQVLKFIQRKIK